MIFKYVSSRFTTLPFFNLRKRVSRLLVRKFRNLNPLFLLISLIGLNVSYSQYGWGAGIEFPGQGTASAMRGGADVAGVHQPTAGFLNPGNLSRLKGLQLTYQHALIWSHIDFNRASSAVPQIPEDPSFPNAGQGSSTNQEPLFPLNGLLAMSYQINPEWTVGLSIHGPNGSGSSDFSKTGSQRYLMTGLEGLMGFIGGSVAYGRDHWGIGATFQYAAMPSLKYRLIVDGQNNSQLNPYLSTWDVEAEVDVSDYAAYSAIIGGWYQFSPAFEVAFSGRVIPVHFNAEGTVRIFDSPTQPAYSDELLEIDGGDAGFDLSLPRTARLGFRYKHHEHHDESVKEANPKERFDIELAVVYEEWSSVDVFNVDLEGKLDLFNDPLIDVQIPKKWKDTWSTRLGGSYNVSSSFSISLGGFWEQGTSPKEYAHVDFPSFDRWGMASGVSYSIDSRFTFMLAFMHIFESSSEVSETYAKVFQQRPIAPCPDFCGMNDQGQNYSGVPANAGKISASFQSLSLGIQAQF